MTQRRVGNLLGLAVLAVLAERPMHRYEMATVIRERGKDRQLAVKWGSLYTVVDSLARHGLVAVAGSDRDGARPERTIYRITPAGAAELHDWTRDLLRRRDGETDAFVAGLSMLAVVSPEEATSLLEQRADDLRADIATLRSALTETTAQLPRLFLIEDEYALSQLEAQLAWVTGFLAELTGASFPDLALWRDQQAHDLPGLTTDPTPTKETR